MSGRLEGKVAIVTGGGGGIGRATVLGFAQEGASVVVAEIDQARGRATEQEASSARVRYVHLDAGDETSWRRLLDETLALFGSLQVLVNNAAQRQPLTLEHTTLEAWHANQRVTSDGVFLGTKLAAEVMTGRCSIVNVASIGAFIGLPRSLAYSAAKGSVRALSRSAALHFAAQGRDIRVNVVAPGATLTDAVRAQLELIAAREKSTPEAVLAGITQDVPMKRMADPRELANAILFLASDEASFVTGAELIVDGGQTAA